MTRAERSALVLSARARELGGMALFTCPRWPGELRIRPQTCGENYANRAAASRSSDAWIRLSLCHGCPVGASNTTGPAPKRLPPTGSFAQAKPKVGGTFLDIAERVVRANPGLTARDGGVLMKISRATANARFLELVRAGRARCERPAGHHTSTTWWPV